MKNLLAAFLLISAVAWAQDASCTEVIDRVVAVVGPEVITLSELQGEMAPALSDLTQKLRGDELAAATDRLRRQTLNNLIDKQLQLQQAKLDGIEISPEEVDDAVKDIMKKNNLDEAGLRRALSDEGFTLEDYKKNLADQLVIVRLVSRTVKSKITLKGEEVTTYYEQNKPKFTQPESVRVANIFFPSPKGTDPKAGMEKALTSAKDALAQIKAGAPFEDMAAKCTGDPDMAKKCVLGTFGKGELSPVIEQAAFKMQTGEVSEPILVDSGYQLLKVIEHTKAQAQTLEEARPQVVEELTAKQGQDIFAKWVQELRKRTYVEIRD
jgi:peptidyl-prolyl cis-trans isomerase SurA